MNGTLRALVLMAVAAVLAGCEETPYWQQPMAENGLVVILPGIQGVDDSVYSINRGLDQAGLRQAVVIQTWGKPVPIAGMLLNQVDKLGCRLDAVAIAGKIMAYQNHFPDKPVHIIGHSAGGAVAVFVTEGLSDQAPAGAKPIEGLVLLSPSISNIYDLTKSLSMCNKGILNCYNPNDVALLGVGTTVLGNLDGLPGPSAGLDGFAPLSELDRADKKAVYENKLTQLLVSSYGEAHFASTNSSFIAGEPAAWIMGLRRRR